MSMIVDIAKSIAKDYEQTGDSDFVITTGTCLRFYSNDKTIIDTTWYLIKLDANKQLDCYSVLKNNK